jgi:hypothetical protein
VVGIEINNSSKAYDWNRLKKLRIINDTLGGIPIVLVLAADDQSFMAFERPMEGESFTLQHDTLMVNGRRFDFSGRDIAMPATTLKRVNAYQEFWHSWQTFHPGTVRDE